MFVLGLFIVAWVIICRGVENKLRKTELGRKMLGVSGIGKAEETGQYGQVMAGEL